MKKLLLILLALTMCVSMCACGNKNKTINTTSTSTVKSNFTNKYGTSTTKCAFSGCDNYIAKSGDTNCCTTHSNRCMECKCYIDGDAMFCMKCIEDALGN